jgi:hypothetical protein
MVEGRWVLRIRSAPLRAPLPPYEERMRMKIDAPRFVREWALAPSVDVVAERMGMTRGAVMIYASKLRKLGVKMKSFKHVDTSRLMWLLSTQ